jgi:hypothetical protein
MASDPKKVTWNGFLDKYDKYDEHTDPLSFIVSDSILQILGHIIEEVNWKKHFQHV